MHYSKENIRGTNSCVLIHVFGKRGVRCNYSRGKRFLEGSSRYLKSMVEQTIDISRRITPRDKGTVVESRVKACLMYLGERSETCL